LTPSKKPPRDWGDGSRPGFHVCQASQVTPSRGYRHLGE
jgi:hypothetical protein